MAYTKIAKVVRGGGGTDAEKAKSYYTPMDDQNDAIQSAGLVLVDTTHVDEQVTITRDANDLVFKDISNNDYITLSALAGKVPNFTASESLVPGNAVYIDASNSFAKVDPSSSSAKLGMVGVCTSTTSSGQKPVVVVSGNVAKGVLSGATAGKRYYVQANGTIGTASPLPNRAILAGYAANSTDLFVLVQDCGRSTPPGYQPTDETGCFLWLRSDLGVTLNSTTVSAWANQGSAGGSFAQSTASKQPGYISSGINGYPALVWTYANATAMTNSTITNSASNYQFFFAVNPVSTQSAGGLWLFDATSGRLIFTQASLASPNGKVAFYSNGAYKGNAAGTTGPQVLSFELTNTSTTSSAIYRNGAVIAQNLDYGAQVAIGGTIGLGCVNNASAGYFDGYIYEVIALNSPSTDARRRVETYLMQRYGIASA